MNVLVEMFLRFFICGLFSIGGGLATLPFLYSISEQTGWYTYDDISNMIAISESSPGPLGVNMATYVGYQTEGLVGALVAPLALVFPSVIVIILVSKMLDKFKTAPVVQHALYGLRAASAALIAAAGLGVAKIALFHTEAASESVLAFFNWKAIVLAAALYVGLKKFPKHPIFYIVISAAVGVILKF